MALRIFIAINLPEGIKDKLVEFQEKWKEIPCKWTKRENLHITLLFIGYLKEELLPDVISATKEVAKRHKSFWINLNKISYFPPQKKLPKMIWVLGERSEELFSLQKDLENIIFKNNSLSKILIPEKREFSCHITLARIKKWQLKEMENFPEIETKIKLGFKVGSIEIMESKLKRSGPKYSVLESFPLS